MAHKQMHAPAHTHAHTHTSKIGWTGMEVQHTAGAYRRNTTFFQSFSDIHIAGEQLPPSEAAERERFRSYSELR